MKETISNFLLVIHHKSVFSIFMVNIVDNVPLEEFRLQAVQCTLFCFSAAQSSSRSIVVGPSVVLSVCWPVCWLVGLSEKVTVRVSNGNLNRGREYWSIWWTQSVGGLLSTGPTLSGSISQVSTKKTFSLWVKRNFWRKIVQLHSICALLRNTNAFTTKDGIKHMDPWKTAKLQLSMKKFNFLFKKKCSLLCTDWFGYILEPHNNGLNVKSIARV